MFTVPNPRNPVEAALLVRVAARALVLFTQSGYTYRKEDGQYPYYVVNSPEGKSYLVDPYGDHCTCPFHKDHGYCKHTMAVDEMLEDEARVAAYEEEQARIRESLGDAFTPEY